jgi:quercetin dioxygenase-like cupin family protein
MDRLDRLIAQGSTIEFERANANHRRNSTMQLANIVDNGKGAVLNLPHGTRMEVLSPSREDAYSVMRGTIPPGVNVPLHSHSDAESFYVLAGEGEVLVQTAVGLEWRILRQGEFIHIHGGTRHAWRNRSCEPLSMLIICAARLGRALQEMAQVDATPAAIQRLTEISERYGYWLGSPEENASVGIVLS